LLALLEMSGDPFAEGVFARCGVRRRHLELSEQILTAEPQDRRALIEERLFTHAIGAVDQLELEPSDIGTVITATLYSLGVPALAHRLADHYGIEPGADKYHLVGVGCASAVPLIRLAQQSLRERHAKKALIVAAENMSGMLARAAPDDSRAKIVGSAIFGDGCAAAVIEDGASGRGPEIVASAVHQIAGTLEAVRMEHSERDSYLHLERDLPDVAAAGLAPLVEDFLRPLELTRSTIDHWIVHPGGRRILECVQEALSLSDAQVAASYDVLANHGNIGTPTIFYVLEQMMRRSPAPGERGLIVTVGPGITVGLMLLVF
jgi:alkylresorcinol/alkylpyrone synthase